MYLFKRGEIYYIQYTTQPGDHIHRISTKCKNKREAFKFLTNLKEEIENRKKSRVNSITLQEYINHFMSYSQIVHSLPTQSNYLYTLNEFSKSVGNVLLTNVDRRMISDFLEKRLAGSIYRAEQSQTYLLSFFNKAITDGYLQINPVKSVKKIKRPVKMPLFFREEEFKSLLEVIEDEDIKDLVRFAVNTGLRRNELLTLEWYQINLKDRFLILDNIKYQNKGKKVSTVPLNNTAVEILNRRQESKKNELVFTLNGKKILPDYITKNFKKFIIAAKVNPDLNFHSLRHTFASWLVQRNVPIQQVKELLRHSDIKTSLIYAHLKPENLIEAVELLN
jgi:integrase